MMLQNLVQSALAPLITEIQQTTYGQFPTLASSPVELAAGVVRGHVPPERAFEEAKKGGIDKDPFQLLLDNAGQPLALQALLEAWRRGIIPEAGTGADSVSLDQGIRESDLKDKWTAVVKALQFQLPDPSTVIEGWLRAQLEEPKARDLLRQHGIDQETATLMYRAAGRPPSPEQLLELWHRGKIPLKGLGGTALSVEQGFYETDLKNKWFDAWTALGEYLPPPRTVTAMIREGALTDAQGTALLKAAGLPPELLASYLAAAHHQKTAASKQLAKGDVIAAYKDGLFDRPTAVKGLAILGWTAEEAAVELDIADFQVRKALLDAAIGRVRSAYTARKISAQVATKALQELGVPATGIQRYLAVWQVSRAQLVLRLTAAQWGAAVKNGWITAEAALQQLQGMGYSPLEAWILLSDQLKAPATDSPPPADLPTSYTGPQ